MATYILHLNQSPFENIKAGRKTIEMRLYDEKRCLYNVGDILIFINRANEQETIKTKIVALHRYANFEELYKHFDKTLLGYRENETASFKDMEAYYPLDEQAKYGVVGIELKLI